MHVAHIYRWAKHSDVKKMKIILMERIENSVIDTKDSKNQKRIERKAGTDKGEYVFCRYLIHFDIFI